MKAHPQILARLFNAPQMATPEFLQYVVGFLQAHTAGAALQALPVVPEGAARPAMLDERHYDSLYPAEQRALQPGGIALVGVMGGLHQRGGFNMADCSMMQGYDLIRRDIEAALVDPNVRGIALNVDSPGGEAAGNFALADFIHAARDVKPIRALVNEYAYSAAYSIAAATDRIYVPETGGVGSVGVIAAHVSVEKALAQAGVEVTYITAGADKALGNSTEALSEAGRAKFQASVNSLYEVFTHRVALYRDLQQSAVKATEARTYDAADAVTVGFADEILSVDEALAHFREDLTADSRPSSFPGSGANAMTRKEGAESGTDDKSVPVTFTQQELDAARADGVKAGAEAEHARIFAVLDHPIVIGPARAKAAVKYARLGMSAEQAVIGLEEIPGETPVVPEKDDDKGDTEKDDEKDEEKDSEPDALARAMHVSGNGDGSGVDAQVGRRDAMSEGDSARTLAEETADLMRMARGETNEDFIGGRPNGR